MVGGLGIGAVNGNREYVGARDVCAKQGGVAHDSFYERRFVHDDMTT